MASPHSSPKKEGKFEMANGDGPEPRLQFERTRLCSFFLEGRCRYGSNCTFAHGEDKLESQPDLTKTSLCQLWMQGKCTRTAANCRFAHGKHELRAAPAMKNRPKKDGAEDKQEDEEANVNKMANDLLKYSNDLASMNELALWGATMGIPPFSLPDMENSMGIDIELDPTGKCFSGEDMSNHLPGMEELALWWEASMGMSPFDMPLPTTDNAGLDIGLEIKDANNPPGIPPGMEEIALWWKSGVDIGVSPFDMHAVGVDELEPQDVHLSPLAGMGDNSLWWEPGMDTSPFSSPVAGVGARTPISIEPESDDAPKKAGSPKSSCSGDEVFLGEPMKVTPTYTSNELADSVFASSLRPKFAAHSDMEFWGSDTIMGS